MEGNQGSMCRSWRKKKGSIAAADIEVGGFANKVPLLFPQKKELKLVFKIRILRKDSSYSFFFPVLKVFIAQCLKGTPSLYIPSLCEDLSLKANYGNAKPEMWGCWCVGEPEWLRLLSRPKLWKQQKNTVLRLSGTERPTWTGGRSWGRTKKQRQAGCWGIKKRKKERRGERSGKIKKNWEKKRKRRAGFKSSQHMLGDSRRPGCERLLSG